MSMKEQTREEFDQMMREIDRAVYDMLALWGLPDNAVITGRREIKFPDEVKVWISKSNGISLQIADGPIINLKCCCVTANDDDIIYQYSGFLPLQE